jgi:hypothetical protein
MLDESFAGVSIDPILLRLSDPSVEPGYVDPRHWYGNFLYKLDVPVNLQHVASYNGTLAVRIYSIF